MNIYDYLDNLPSNTTKIDVSYKNLNIIPDLSKFVDLEILICNNNNEDKKTILERIYTRWK